MPEEPKERPWDKTPFPGWRATVNAWRWDPTGPDSWEKSGTCPRCEHGITVTKQGGLVPLDLSEEALMEIMVEAERGRPVTTRSDDTDQLFARCDCGEKHPGRPADLARGCGQWAEIDPPPGV